MVVWQPVYKLHATRIESVQKQLLIDALKILGWNNVFELPSYQARCRLINIEPLNHRRLNLSIFFLFELRSGRIDAPGLLTLIRFNVLT